MIFHTKRDLKGSDLFQGTEYDGDLTDTIIYKGEEGFLAAYHPEQAMGLSLLVQFKGHHRPWLISPDWIVETVYPEDLMKPRMRRLLAVLRNPDEDGDPNMVEIRNFDDLSGKSWLENNVSAYGVLGENTDIEESSKRLDVAEKVAKLLGVEEEHYSQISNLRRENMNIRFTKFSFYIYNCYDVDEVIAYIESYGQDRIPYMD